MQVSRLGFAFGHDMLGWLLSCQFGESPLSVQGASPGAF